MSQKERSSVHHFKTRKILQPEPKEERELPRWAKELRDYFLLTVATILMDVGVYVFKFPNNFSFGGVSGMAVVLARIGSFSASTYNLIINMALLVLGFLFLGKSFGVRTVFVTVLSSLMLSWFEVTFPMSAPITGEPMLELIFAIVLPSIAAAIMFNINASGGGTDIIAMILKKYTTLDSIGMALFIVDLFVTLTVFFVFDIQTALFSMVGLMTKTLVIDGAIESINLSKYFTIICDDPEPICDYITQKLHRSATVYHAEGAYTHNDRTVIMTVIKRSQAVLLRNFVHEHEKHAFITITNSSEIIGKGFRD